MKHYILLLLLASAFWYCSNDEDVVPSNNDRNMFDMPDFSSEEEMKVRRDFYDATSCYLIFNDSLYYRNITTPSGSDPECVILDLKYQVKGTSEDALLRYTYLKDMKDKELAAKFAKEKILPRLAPAFYPYTFLWWINFISVKLPHGVAGTIRKSSKVLMPGITPHWLPTSIFMIWMRRPNTLIVDL